MLNNIIKRDKLRQNKELAEKFVQTIERTLYLLPRQQQEILAEFFIDRSKGHIERLMEKYHVEQSMVYKLKNEALRNFTLLRSGYIET